jgi:hypothetical protein
MVQGIIWRHPQEVANASQLTGVPAAAIEAIMQTEGSGDTATSPAGAMGPMQVMPFHFTTGQNPFDLQTNINVGAQVLKNGFDATGSWAQAAGRYFGIGTDAGGMTTGGYIQRFTNFLQQLGGIQAQPVGTTGGVTDVAPPAQIQPPTETQTPTTTTQPTATSGSNVPPPTGLNLSFAGSIQHIIFQFLLVLFGIALLLGGIYLLGSRK